MENKFGYRLINIHSLLATKLNLTTWAVKEFLTKDLQLSGFFVLLKQNFETGKSLFIEGISEKQVSLSFF